MSILKFGNSFSSDARPSYSYQIFASSNGLHNNPDDTVDFVVWNRHTGLHAPDTFAICHNRYFSHAYYDSGGNNCGLFDMNARSNPPRARNQLAEDKALLPLLTTSFRAKQSLQTHQ